jgi:hypothetical protein
MRFPSLSRARAALSRRAATLSSFTRASAPAFASDFDHHAPGIARLNHGSFGATPAPVLAATEACRARWLAQPDDEYFSGALDAELQGATAAAADAIGAPAAETALVENATVAAAIVFRRWSQLDGMVLLPANAYGGVKASALAAFGPQRVREWPFPFPGTTHAHILDWLDQALTQHDPRYVLLDHVSSQPAVVCPVAEMVALCRRRGVAEVAVDGAHALGQVAINVDEIGSDLSQITVNAIDATLDQWLIPHRRGLLLLQPPQVGVRGADGHGPALAPARAAARRALVGSGRLWGGMPLDGHAGLRRDARSPRGVGVSSGLAFRRRARRAGF